MKIIRIFTLLVILLLLNLCVVACVFAGDWFPQSSEKVQNNRKFIIRGQIERLAGKDNFFNQSFIDSYTESLTNSLNKNKGRAAIVAHDSQRWCFFTFSLNEEGNITNIQAIMYKKDFGKTFQEYHIDQSKWLDLVSQINTQGYAITNIEGGSFKYYCDYDDKVFTTELKRYYK